MSVNEAHGRYLELLRKWSSKIAMVSAADRAEGLERHVRDSLVVLEHVPVEATTLVDVGAGGGFPGVILAIERPALRVVQLEPHRKKWAFLRAVRRELGLSNLEPLAERDEEHLARPDFTPYDVAVSRATFAPAEWLTRAMRLVRAGGLALAMEGREREELPPETQRHPYELEGRQRAILVRRRPD